MITMVTEVNKKINVKVEKTALLLKTLILLFPILLCNNLFAQQIGPKVLNLDDVNLEYPKPWDREALVVLDFTVKSDGSVDDIKTAGGFHEPRFVDAATAAVRQLQFEPATEGGEAVDWPGYRITARFVYRDLFHTMNVRSNEELKKAEKSMSENKAAEAEEILKKALAEQTRLFFEDAIFHLRLGEIYLATQRPALAVHELKLATQTSEPGEHRDFNGETAQTHNIIQVVNITEWNADDYISTRLLVNNLENKPRVPYPAPLRGGNLRGKGKSAAGVLQPKVSLEVLNNTLLQSAYQRDYIANISTGNVAEVINTYNSLEHLNNKAISDQMKAQIAQVKQLQNSDQRLTSAQVIYNGETVHYPSHRILAAVNVNGDIETVDFQCENRVIRLPFQAEVEWRMPESWGQCALRFRGDDGATFNVVEFPN